MKKTGHDFHGKTAFISGASSGIGAAVARLLAKNGLRVFLVARRADRLGQLAEEIRRDGGTVEFEPADLAQPGECQRVVERVHAVFGGVDVLVNNAGFGWYGYYADMPWKTAREMLGVNIEAVMALTQSFLAEMRSRGQGHIINIGSIVGDIPSQGVAVYSASKAYLNAFSTCLHREMKGSGVQISEVRPGPVRTEFYEAALNRPAGRAIPAERFAIPAEQVAGVVWGLLRQPRRRVYVPWWLWVTPWVEMLFGGWIDRLGPLLLRLG